MGHLAIYLDRNFEVPPTPLMGPCFFLFNQEKGSRRGVFHHSDGRFSPAGVGHYSAPRHRRTLIREGIDVLPNLGEFFYFIPSCRPLGSSLAPISIFQISVLETLQGTF